MSTLPYDRYRSNIHSMSTATSDICPNLFGWESQLWLTSGVIATGGKQTRANRIVYKSALLRSTFSIGTDVVVDSDNNRASMSLLWLLLGLVGVPYDSRATISSRIRLRGFGDGGDSLNRDGWHGRI